MQLTPVLASLRPILASLRPILASLRPMYAAFGLAAALSSAGCLTSPPEPQTADMCEVTSDCDGGEVCDEGICWGSPPASQFAVVLKPTVTSATAAQTELAGISIAADGTIDGLQFERPVAVRGKVTLKCGGPADGELIACGSDVPISASIRVERDPGFPGGPRYVQTFQTEVDNLGPDESSFELLLPPTKIDANGDPIRPYRITIFPTDPDQGTSTVLTPAELAPPLRLPPFAVAEDTEVEWIVGDPDKLHWVSSCILGASSVDTSVAAYDLDPLTGEEQRISALARTDDQSCFSIRVPRDREMLTIRIQPADATAPTLELRNEVVPTDYTPALVDGCFAGSPDGAFCLDDLLGPGLTTPQSVTVPVRGPDNAGGEERVAGAKVTFFTELVVPQPPTQRSGTLVAYLRVDVTTGANPGNDDHGNAVTSLPRATYQVSVQPQAGERFASIFNVPLDVEAAGVSEPIMVGERTIVSGTLKNSFGVEISDAVIVADASLGFRINYPQIAANIVDSLRTTTTSSASGTFVLYLEPDVAGGVVAPTYDIKVQPSFLAEAPHWTLVDQSFGTAGSTEDLGDVTLPAASFVRGQVTDADGEPVAAAVRIFEITGDDVCNQNGQLCAPLVLPRGSWLGDESSGFWVKAVLPRR